MKNLLALVAASGLALAGLSHNTATAQATSLQSTDHLTVPQWVNPETPGELSGRLILPSTDGTSEPIGDATVVMTNSEGKTVRGHTDAAGQFVLQGVQPGVYALTARAQGVFACCAMHVVDSKMASADLLPGKVEVAAAAIDYTVIKTSILRYLPPFADKQPFSLSEADLKGISGRVVGENMFRVTQTDGGLKGRIHVAGARGSVIGDAGVLNVFLIQNGEIIDRVVSKRNGTFEFADLLPGGYSILAIGQAGLGMAGFELIEGSLANGAAATSSEGARVGSDGRTLVSALNDPCCTEFSMQIAPLPMAMQAFEEVIINEDFTADPGEYAMDQFGNPIEGVDQFGNPMGGGGFGGGGYGGGGGGFGGGGGGFGGGGGGFGGGLGGLAAIGGIAAIAASDRNSGNDLIITPRPPASPTRAPAGP